MVATFYILPAMDAVDIVLPTHNRLSTLPRAIESVLNQSHERWTLWIVDDGSTDGTAEWLNLFLKQQQDPRLRRLAQCQRGVSAARNLGIRQGTHPWIALIDSDDEWLPEKLELQLKALHSEGRRWCHSEEIWIRNGERVNAGKKHQKAGGWQFERSLELCCISPSAVLLERDLLDKWGLFNEEYPVCEDFELWLRLTLAEPISFVDQPLIRKYGGHSDQLSRRYHSMDYWRIRAVYDLMEIRGLWPAQLRLARQALDSVVQRSSVLLNGCRKHSQFLRWNEIFAYRKWAIAHLLSWKVETETLEDR